MRLVRFDLLETGVLDLPPRDAGHWKKKRTERLRDQASDHTSEQASLRFNPGFFRSAALL